MFLRYRGFLSMSGSVSMKKKSSRALRDTQHPWTPYDQSDHPRLNNLISRQLNNFLQHFDGWQSTCAPTLFVEPAESFPAYPRALYKYAIKKRSSSIWFYTWASGCLRMPFIVGGHTSVTTPFSCCTSLISKPWIRARYVLSTS